MTISLLYITSQTYATESVLPGAASISGGFLVLYKIALETSAKCRQSSIKYQYHTLFFLVLTMT